MSADEDVVIRMQAEHQGTLEALEAVSDAFRRMGDRAHDAGQKQKESTDWAGKGWDELTGRITGATSAMSLFEKGVDAVAEALKVMDERRNRAFEERMTLA